MGLRGLVFSQLKIQESRVPQARAESIKKCSDTAEYQKMTSHKSLESSQSTAIIV
jgi:hypothetical protein